MVRIVVDLSNCRYDVVRTVLVSQLSYADPLPPPPPLSASAPSTIKDRSSGSSSGTASDEVRNAKAAAQREQSSPPSSSRNEESRGGHAVASSSSGSGINLGTFISPRQGHPVSLEEEDNKSMTAELESCGYTPAQVLRGRVASAGRLRVTRPGQQVSTVSTTGPSSKINNSFIGKKKIGTFGSSSSGALPRGRLLPTTSSSSSPLGSVSAQSKLVVAPKSSPSRARSSLGGPFIHNGGNNSTGVGSTSTTMGESSKFIVYSGIELAWSDLTFTPTRVTALQQREALCNHFLGIEALSRKLQLAQCLTRYQRFFPGQYDFFPTSFTSYQEYLAHSKKASARAGGLQGSEKQQQQQQQQQERKDQGPEFFICKPTAGCMGRGVQLVDKITSTCFSTTVGSVNQSSNSGTPGTGSGASGARPRLGGGGNSRGNGRDSDRVEMVVQQYIDRPFLIQGRKCDLRCYVLVTCFDPLEIFFFEEGLVRLCKTRYQEPTSENKSIGTIHFSNYAINKQRATTATAAGSVSSSSGASSSSTSPTTQSVPKLNPSSSSPQGLSSGGDGTSSDSGSGGSDSARKEEEGGGGGGEKSSNEDDIGIKQNFSFLNRYLVHHLNAVHDESNKKGSPPTTQELASRVDLVWKNIHQVVVKTLIAGQEHIVRAQPFNPNGASANVQIPPQGNQPKNLELCSSAGGLAPGNRTSFEVLGFDIMLDQDLKPWLIEVNHSPSWHVETPLDLQIKQRVIKDAMKIVRFSHDVNGRTARTVLPGGANRLGSSASAGGVSSAATLSTAFLLHGTSKKKKAGLARKKRKEMSQESDTSGGIEHCPEFGGFSQIFPSATLFEASPARDAFEMMLESQREVLNVVSNGGA